MCRSFAFLFTEFFFLLSIHSLKSSSGVAINCNRNSKSHPITLRLFLFVHSHKIFSRIFSNEFRIILFEIHSKHDILDFPSVYIELIGENEIGFRLQSRFDRNDGKRICQHEIQLIRFIVFGFLSLTLYTNQIEFRWIVRDRYYQKFPFYERMLLFRTGAAHSNAQIQWLKFV